MFFVLKRNNSELIIKTSGVYYLTVQMSDTLDAHISIKKNGNVLTYTDRSTKQGNWDGEFLNVLVPLTQGKIVRYVQKVVLTKTYFDFCCLGLKLKLHLNFA